MSFHPQQEEEGLIGTREEPLGELQRSLTRSCLAKASLGAVACAGAVAYTASALTSEQSTRADVESQVELEKSPFVKKSAIKILDLTEYKDTGCSNWNAIQLGGVSLMPTYSACATSCRYSPGCSGFNFQNQNPPQCSGDPSPDGVGSCYRWGPPTCAKAANDCWDNFFLDNPEPTAWSPPDKGQGCGNWNTILLTSLTDVSNAEECGLQCTAHKQAGCVEFGYQANDCGSSGKGARTCYLYKGVCAKEANTCWDHYIMTNYTEPSGPFQVTAGQGCSNYAQILLGQPSFQASAGACGKLCQDVNGCVGFGFQSGLPSQCTPGGSAFTGACYLWSGTCQQESNPCWDNYNVVPNTPAPTPTPAPPPPAPGNQEYCPKSAELRIDYDAQFQTGGVPGNESGSVVLRDQGWTTTGSARVSSKGVWNLLDGWVAFDMDLSKTIVGLQTGADQGPNANLYTVFPQTGSGDYDGTPRSNAKGASQYCDGQGEFTAADKTRANLVPDSLCPEMDIIEANSKLAFATTWHSDFVFSPQNPGDYPGPDPCNQFGCNNNQFFTPAPDPPSSCKNLLTTPPTPVTTSGIDSSKPFTVNASFAADASMTVVLIQNNVIFKIAEADVSGGGNPVTAASLDALAKNMTTFGSAIESSQYNGFVPQSSESFTNVQCNDGTNNLSQSIFSVSKLRIKGTLKRGSASLCDSSSLTPR